MTINPSVRLVIGGETVHPDSASWNSVVNGLPTAQAQVTLKLPVDLTPTIQIFSTGAGEDSEEHVGFTGHIMTATPNGDSLTIDAEGGRSMVESKVGLTKIAVPGIDVIYLLARQTGTELNIRDPDEVERLPQEVFVVEVPIMGLSVDHPATAAGVEFLPFPKPNEALPFAHELADIVQQWGQPTARARTYVTGKWMHDADQAGVARIEAALDAMLATAAYGSSHDPWGDALTFDRSALRSRPTAVPLVFTLGVASKRRWLHHLGAVATTTTLDVDRFSDSWSKVLASDPSPALARALRMLRDAGDETREVFDRCHAISSLLEFYTAKTRAPKIVTKKSRKDAISAIRGLDASSEEISRMLDVLGQVNFAPLLAKVRHQSENDGVPVSEVEWALIARLRSARNDAVHGRSSIEDTPSVDDIRWGMSICARLLLYHWAAEARRS